MTPVLSQLTTPAAPRTIFPAASTRQIRLVWLAAFACALLFAWHTRHAWEDYYITYRSSRNLATGNGLVYTQGERLHTFTSPLGVLLPALASLMTFNSSDAAALWLFRIMGAASFGGAAALIFALCIRHRFHTAAAILVVAWLCTDSKSLDFSINGMETGFMLLFLSYTAWALFSPGVARRALHVGCAWAGLMWTRPDSFILIGLVSAGAWLFNDDRTTGLPRPMLVRLFLKAGLICTLMYLPWFAWAWIYYGSPVPHTVIAKSSISGAKSLAGLLDTLLQAPWNTATGHSTAGDAFLPAYSVAGGWPGWLLATARVAGIAAGFVWLNPRLDTMTRASSVAFLGFQIYLSYFPYFPFPWYLPPAALLAYLAFGGALTHVIESDGTRPRRSLWIQGFAWSGAVLGLGIQLWIVGNEARRMRLMQELIDEGNRLRIGRWLSGNAAPGDSVFLEPLGYIGFTSGLKMLDWPGLASTEVVNARATVGPAWSAIIRYLKPDWLVLRPREVEQINKEDQNLLKVQYTAARDFDVSDRVDPLDVRGLPLLQMDEKFSVFRRSPTVPVVIDSGVLETRYPGTQVAKVTIGGVRMVLVHAPGTLTIEVPAGKTHLRVSFGFSPDAYAAPPITDGATFQVEWHAGDRTEVLHTRTLNPATTPGDRGAFAVDLDLPDPGGKPATIVLRTMPGITDNKDWTCWSAAEFR